MKRYLLLSFLFLWFAGCGDGDAVDTVAFINNASLGGTPGTVRLARLGQAEVANLPVTAFDSAGQEVASARTDASGNFRLPALPTDGHVVAQLPDGLRLSADHRGGAPSWLWISGATTLVSAHLRNRPELTLEQAESDIRTHFGIPEGFVLGSGLGDTWRSPFAWSAFVQAAGDTPLQTFLEQQVAAVGTGSPVSFRVPHPYPNLRAALTQSSEGVAQRAGVRAQDNDADGSAFLSGLVANTAADLVTDGIVAGIGWICEAAGLGFAGGDTSQLDKIQMDIDNLQNKVTQTDYSDDYQAAVNTLNEPVKRIQKATNSFKMTAPNNPSQAATDLKAYVSIDSDTLGSDMEILQTYLLGNQVTASAIFTFSAWLQSTYGNTSPTAANLFLDLRSNAILEQVQAQLDYFRGYQLLGLNLGAEWAHLDPSTFAEELSSGNFNSMVGNIKAAQSNNDTTSQALLQEQMQVPPATIASDDVLVDLTTGTMYYLNIQGPTQAGNILLDSAGFTLGPWTNCWYPATIDQYTRLRTLALAAGNQDYHTGLTAMGFTGVPDESLELQTYTVDQPFLGYTVYDWDKGKSDNKSPTTLSFQYILVRDCPGVTNFYTSIQSPALEDPDTLVAVAQPNTIAAGVSGSSGSVTAQYVYLIINKARGWVTTGIQNVDISDRVSWTTNNSNAVTVSNSAPTGTPTFHTANPGQGSLTANLWTQAKGTPGNADSVLTNHMQSSLSFSALPGTPSNPVITSILVVPLNQDFNGGSTQTPYCFATGFRSDFTVVDLTKLVTWSVTSTKGLAHFDGAVKNQLNLPVAMGDDTNVEISASYIDPNTGQPVKGTAVITTSFAP